MSVSCSWRSQRSMAVGAGGVGAEMDEFGGGFIRNVLIGFALAIAFSIVFVWFR